MEQQDRSKLFLQKNTECILGLSYFNNGLKKMGVKEKNQFDFSQFQKEVAKDILERDGRSDKKISQEILSRDNLKIEYQPQLIRQSIQLLEAISYPMSSFGEVRTGENKLGIGCIIESNVILTCASCCYSRETNEQFQQIFFIPVMLRKYEQFPGFKAKVIHIPSEYKALRKEYQKNTCDLHLFDYAIIILDHKIPGSKIFNGEYNLEDYFGSLGYDFDCSEKKITYYKENNHIKLPFPFRFTKLYTFKEIFQNDKNEQPQILKADDLSQRMKSPLFSENQRGQCQTQTILQSAKDDTRPNVSISLKLQRQMFADIQKNVRKQQIVSKYELGLENIDPSNISQVLEEIKNAESKQANIRKISLNLNHNKLGEKGCSILAKVQWNSLLFLNLNANKIGDEGCRHISQAQWPQLQKLSLDWNNIGEKGCHFLSEAKFINLKVLSLQTNKIKHEGCRQLSKAQWPNLQKLSLSSNKIGDEGCHYLTLSHWNKLQIIMLNEAHIEDQGCEYLAQASWSNLKEIYLNANRIEGHCWQNFVKGQWRNLKSLHLNGNKIGDQGCFYLSKAKWHNLRQLQLAENRIGSEGCLHLSKIVSQNLEVLNLMRSKIGDEGCEYLSKPPWNRLEVLNLVDANIGYSGCCHLIKAQWGNLRQLYLTNNKLGNKGCKIISKGQWGNLESLCLGNNKIEDLGCLYLGKSNWQKLQRLDLQNNAIGFKGCQQLSKSQWRNLQTLNMNNNSIGKHGFKCIQQRSWKIICDTKYFY